MNDRETQHLRVLIANERRDRLALVAPIVAALGHEVIAREIEVGDVGPVTARERPDVALVGLGASSGHALMLIEKIVQEAACPVIVLLHAADPEFVREASKRGVFAYITDADAVDWQSSIDIVLRRSPSTTTSRGPSVVGPRSSAPRGSSWSATRWTIGCIRHAARAFTLGEPEAVDIAAAVVDGHALLPKLAEEPPD